MAPLHGVLRHPATVQLSLSGIPKGGEKVKSPELVSSLSGKFPIKEIERSIGDELVVYSKANPSEQLKPNKSSFKDKFMLGELERAAVKHYGDCNDSTVEHFNDCDLLAVSVGVHVSPLLLVDLTVRLSVQESECLYDDSSTADEKGLPSVVIIDSSEEVAPEEVAPESSDQPVAEVKVDREQPVRKPSRKRHINGRVKKNIYLVVPSSPPIKNQARPRTRALYQPVCSNGSNQPGSPTSGGGGGNSSGGNSGGGNSGGGNSGGGNSGGGNSGGGNSGGGNSGGGNSGGGNSGGGNSGGGNSGGGNSGGGNSGGGNSGGGNSGGGNSGGGNSGGDDQEDDMQEDDDVVMDMHPDSSIAVVDNPDFMHGTHFQEHIDYHVQRNEKLGEGSSGKIFKMFTRDGHQLVVKETSYAITKEEINVYRALKRHENIVDHYGVTFKGSDGKASIFMEKCDLSLYDYIHARGTLLDCNSAMYYWCQVLDAVVYMHNLPVPIVHKDIKAKNVLLCEERTRAKLADFDSAKTLPDEFTKSKLRPVGTEGFAAPEVLEHKPHGTPADMYGMGCLLLELTVGVPLNNSLYQKIEELRMKDSDLADLVTACVNPSPHKRPTAMDVKQYAVSQPTPMEVKQSSPHEQPTPMEVKQSSPHEQPTPMEVKQSAVVQRYEAAVAL